MRNVSILALIVAILSIGFCMAEEKSKAKPSIGPDLLQTAKSEAEIRAWATEKQFGTERFDGYTIERFEIDGKKLLVLLASPPTATYRMEIFVYVGDEKEWSLLLLRYAGTAEVKVVADQKAKELRFRSKGGKPLLTLPVANLEFSADETEE